MYIVLDGSIVKYEGDQEIERVEAPCIVGEEALLY